MKIGVLCNSVLSIPSIQYLIQSGHQVSMALAEQNTRDHFELESFAMHFQIPIIKIQKKNLDQELLFWQASNEFEILFIITFPYIIPKNLISSIGVPMINLHFAPLPQYKGAQPAFWLIKNRDKTGGITAHLITEDIDGGPILKFESYKMNKYDTFGSYNSKMASLNIHVIRFILDLVNQKNWKKGLKKQNKSLSNYYPKLELKDIRIDWKGMKANEIEQLCRACNPWNKGAITTLNNSPIKIVEVEIVDVDLKMVSPGQIVAINNSVRMAVATSDSKFLEIKIAYEENLGFYGQSRLSEIGLKEGQVFN